MNSDLMMSILAMDAYNHDDRHFYNVPETGNIGGIQILDRVVDATAGFFAIAYKYQGQIIVSFRGTDNPEGDLFHGSDILYGSDVAYGWSVGAGVIEGTQASNAIQFFEKVVRTHGGVSGYSVYEKPPENIVVTGHSLGGGLATFISALSHVDAVVFDHMPSGIAATAQYVAQYLDRVSGSEEVSALLGVYASTKSERLELLKYALTSQSETLIEEARQAIGLQKPQLSENIQAFHVDGEFLQFLRDGSILTTLDDWSSIGLDFAELARKLIGSATNDFGETIAANEAPINNHTFEVFGWENEGKVARHNQALQVALMYADQTGHFHWRTSAQSTNSVLNALFDDEVATSIGIEMDQNLPIGKADRMIRMIAYSALETGTRPFGDVAIKALFDDADELGRVISDGPSQVLSGLVPELGKMLVQFAGQTAFGGIQDNAEAEKGVLRLSEDRQLLAINLVDSRWSLNRNGAPPDHIFAADEVREFATSATPSLGAHLQWLWAGDLKVIDIVNLAAHDAPLDAELTARDPSDGDGVTLTVGGDGDDSIRASTDNDLIVSGKGNDKLWGGGGDDLLVGGDGNDELRGGQGKNVLIGGNGDDDLAIYDEGGSQWLSLSGGTQDGEKFVHVASASGGEDRAFDIEIVRLSSEDDIVFVSSLEYLGHDKLTIDGGTGSDQLNFSAAQSGLYFGSSGVRNAVFGDNTLAAPLIDLAWFGDRVDYKNVQQIVATSHNDVFNDTRFQGEVFLGDGDDTLMGAGLGALVHLGTGGADKVWIRGGVGVTDLDFNDVVSVAGLLTLHGGLRKVGSEQNYATSHGGMVQYGVNGDGELVIHFGVGSPNDDVLKNMYFLGWTNTQVAQGTGGAMIGAGNIFLADYQIKAYNIGEAPSQAGNTSLWGLLGLAIKAYTGHDWGGQDPLVLDLDGDGLDLTALNSYSPRFDVDADLYDERSGWVGQDDGMLVRDIGGDGQILDSRELFGGRTSGFGVLATLDGNGDGVVNAADNGLADFDGDGVIDANDTFSDLKIWRDLDQDGKADAGELRSLSEYDITGLTVAHTKMAQSVSGNLVTGTSTFIRGDGSTGLLGEAVLRLDNANSHYTGAPITVSADAELRPDLKGFGTLVSLRQALSVEAGGLALVDSAMATLDAADGHDMASIRAAIRPILQAWAQGSPIRLADGSIVHGAAALPAYSDIAVIRADSHVTDYAWDLATAVSAGQQTGTWSFVSGLKAKLTMSGGQSLVGLSALHDTLGTYTAVVTAQTLVGGQLVTQRVFTFANGAQLAVWGENPAAGTSDTLATILGGEHDGSLSRHFAFDTVLGSDLAFIERYLGELLPFHEQPQDVTQALALVETAIQNMNGSLDLIGARLAVQSAGFAGIFEGLKYDAADNSFSATTSQQLIPTFTNLLELAGQQADPAAWLAEWRPLLAVVIGDFTRGDGLLATNGWLAQNILGAYEAAHPAFDLQTAAMGLGLSGVQIFTGSGEVVGTDGNDIFFLAGADQTAMGGLGLDNYVIGATFGHVVISDIEPALREQDGDVLRFTKHLASDFTVVREGVDLIMTVNATGETVRIVGQFYGEWFGPFGGGYWPDQGVESITFADGEVWDQLDMAAAASRIDAGSTTVIGTADNDVLEGGAGDDRLEGAGDGDIYYFGLGDQHDVVLDVEDNAYRDSFDLIQFRSGIKLDDLIFSRDGANEDLLITVKGTDDSLLIEGQFSATYTGPFGVWWINQIEMLSFADGSYLGKDQLFDIVLGHSQTSGDDIIYGYDREDVLDGGAGNDFVSGGNENDIYRFGRGDGHDVVQDKTDILIGGMTDTLSFKDDVAVNDVVFSRVGQDLIATIADTGDSIRLVNQYVITETGPFGWLAWDMIEKFAWADGTVKTWWDVELEVLQASQTAGDDVVLGTHFDDVIDAGTGDDQLLGGNGADTYRFGLGDGHDVVSDHLENWLANDGDLIAFKAGVSADDILVERYGSNLMNVRLTIGSTGDTISIVNQFAYTSIAAKDWEVESFSFADGTLWTPGDLRRRYLAQHSTSGNDVLEGFWTDDILTGGTGDDILRGGDSNDTYVFNLGFGHDVIEEAVLIISYDDDDNITFGAGLNSTDAKLIRNGDDLTIAFAGLTDTVTIKGQFTKLAYFQGWSDIETIHFGDGVSWTDPQIRVALIAQETTAGDDHTRGFAEADVFNSSAGDDVIEGFGGGDTYHFGHGSGHDKVYESISTTYEDQDDTIVFGPDLAVGDVRFARHGEDLVISILGAGDTLTVVGHFANNDFDDVERFKFADGTVLTSAQVELLATANQGTPGDDLILGTPRDNVLDGGAGNDRLEGDKGDDSYVFDVGYGHDVVRDFDSGQDKVLFGAGVTPAMVEAVRSDDDLVLTVGAGGDTLTIENYFFLSYFLVEEFRFVDGTMWTKPDILTLLYGTATPIIGDNGSADMAGSSGDDVLVTLGGFETVAGGDGGDTYFLGSGGKTIVESAANGDYDVLRVQTATSTQVTLTRSGDDAVLTYTGGSVRIVGQFAAQAIESVVFNDGVSWSAEDIRATYLAKAGTPGADTIIGFEGRDDTIAGLAGDDLLRGGSGGDSYLFGLGGGRDTIRDLQDAGSIDKLVFSADIAAGDVIFVKGQPGAGDLTLKIGTSAQVILQGELLGDGSGVEQVVFADGTSWDRAMLLSLADAAEGTDLTLHGDAGANALVGGAGNDSLYGGGGNDTYFYNAGGGVDIVYEGALEGSDKVVFGSGLSFDKLQIFRDGSSAKFSFDGFAGSLTVDGEWSGSGRGVELFVFAGGFQQTAAEISALWLERQTTSGNDTIVGFNGADILRGGLGDDQLSGGTGDDVYLYNAGDGADVIEDPDYGSNDKLVLGPGLTFDKLQIQRSGTTAVLSFTGVAGSITLNQNWNGSSHGVETVVFDDGVQKTAGQLAEIWLQRQATSGTDTLTGFSFADTLQGGLGNDLLKGAGGDDTYVYNIGDGYDRIVEAEAAGADKLVLGSGLTANLATVTHVGDTYTLSFSGYAGSVTIEDADSAVGGGIEQIVFGNGLIWTRQDLLNAALGDISNPTPTKPFTAGNDVISGTSGADVLAGGLGDDKLTAAAGSDIYRYYDGDGADQIVEAAASSDVDRLMLGTGLNAADLRVARSGASGALVTFVGHAGSILLDNQFYSGTGGYGIEQFLFADGTVWGAADLRALYIASLQTSGNDTIQGFSSSADILQGGLGDDSLTGASGSDIYLYNDGDGADKIYESYQPGESDKLVVGAGLLKSDLIYTRSGSWSASVTLSFAGHTGSVLLDSQFNSNATYGVEQIQFADGTVWSVADLRADYLAKVQTAGNDTIYGFDGVADALRGGKGDDSLTGYAGSDTYFYNDGDGADKIYESYQPSDLDKLVFGAGLSKSDLVYARSGSWASNLTLSFAGHAGSVFLDSQFYSNATYGIERFHFDDGSVWSLADLRADYLAKVQTAGNDTIYGFDGVADTLQGGLGDDTLTGYAGSDTYVYNDGDGADKIYESYQPGESDKLLFGAGLNLTDLQVTRSGTNATLTFTGHAGSILIDSQFNSQVTYGIESFQFSNGDTLTAAQLADRAWYRGGVGNDAITGASGSDRIDGGAGNDTLSGAAGADTLVGGAGNDSLSGGAGADTFIFNGHFGSDTVTDFKVDGADVLEFRDNLFANFADLLAHSQQVGADVVITHAVDEVVTLKAAQMASLTQADFLFVT